MNSNKQPRQNGLLFTILAAAMCLAVLSPARSATAGAQARLDSLPKLATSIISNVNAAVADRQWFGATEAEWTQRWWRWWTSIPYNVGPTNDTDGVQCGINQSGPVWFIGGPVGTTFTRSCTIPRGKAILAPIINYLNDYLCPDPSFQPAQGQTLEDFLISGAKPIMDGVSVHTAELDGKPLTDRRIIAGLFGFTAAADLKPLDACFTGSPQLGTADGYFVFINPLPAGQHALHIHSELPGLSLTSDGTYILNVK